MEILQDEEKAMYELFDVMDIWITDTRKRKKILDILITHKNRNGNRVNGFEKLVFIPEKLATFNYFAKGKKSVQRREFDHYLNLKLDALRKNLGDNIRINKLIIEICYQKMGRKKVV